MADVICFFVMICVSPNLCGQVSLRARLASGAVSPKGTFSINGSGFSLETVFEGRRSVSTGCCYECTDDVCVRWSHPRTHQQTRGDLCPVLCSTAGAPLLHTVWHCRYILVTQCTIEQMFLCCALGCTAGTPMLHTKRHLVCTVVRQ